MGHYSIMQTKTFLTSFAFSDITVKKNNVISCDSPRVVKV